MTNNLSVGQVLTPLELINVPAGVTLERTSDGWKITEVPQVNTREELCVELYAAAHPDHSRYLIGGSVHATYLRVSDFVISHFTRNDAHSPVAQLANALPAQLVDGDGDTWYLQSNEKYSTAEISDNAQSTMRDVQVMFGIRSTSDSPPPVTITDGDGDVWELQPDGTYTMHNRFGSPRELSTADYLRNKTVEYISREHGLKAA